MDLIAGFLDLVVHLDQHLRALAQNYGNWIYAVLFLIVFLETGLVVTPFLPGDSLLFVAGTIAAAGELHVHGLVLLLIVAAIVGDSVNYAVGSYLGRRVFRYEDSRFFKRAYLERTHAFFERHGGKTIIIARFVPIIRTYAPFVAGIGTMSYRQFLLFNVTGGLLWVASLTYAGYFFGNLPVVKDNLTLVIVGIIVLSIMPGIIEFWRARRAS
ncbi:MAG TPA: DedA family protein [Burkholderiales bacterium]|jgi:membrane-associated protein|nr:DedA family protein [Burkholderiales bacterium]